MIYYKPKDVTYTQMAIWIDANAYSDNCDDNKLFEYLYHLALVLAYKSKYFSTNTDYDNYAIYCASFMFFRYKNPKQFVEENQMRRIKSSLNYLKRILYPMKVQYQQKSFVNTIKITTNPNSDANYNLNSNLLDSAQSLSKVEFMVYLEDICKTIRGMLKQIPEKKYSSEPMDIYTSCLLTFLNSISIPNYDLERCRNLHRSSKIIENSYDALFRDLSKESPILFHLNENMSDYINILMRKIKISIQKDLRYLISNKIPIGELALDAYNNTVGDNKNDNQPT